MDKEKLLKLKLDIKDLQEKLLAISTNDIRTDEDRKKTRDLRSILKDKISTFETISKAEEIIKTRVK